MLGGTHRMIAVTSATAMGLFHLSTASLVDFVIILVAATLPDCDRKFGMKHHRKFTHSLLCFSIIGAGLLYIYPAWFLPYAIGYGSHLVADSFTKMGVPFFYPWKKTFGAKLISTGGTWEWTIYGLCLMSLFFIAYMKFFPK